MTGSLPRYKTVRQYRPADMYVYEDQFDIEVDNGVKFTLGHESFIHLMLHSVLDPSDPQGLVGQVPIDHENILDTEYWGTFPEIAKLQYEQEEPDATISH